MQVVAITGGEIDALHGAGPLAFQAYILLRAWMDYGSGITGRSRPISLAMLGAYCETHTPRGGGVQIAAPSEKAVRTALDRLQRAGLLRRLPGERLAFSLPLAVNVSARPEQTRHGGGTQLPTEPGTAKPKSSAACERIPGTPETQPARPNPAHIMNHGLLSSTCALATYLRDQGIDPAPRGELLARWRTAGVTLPALEAAVTAGRAVRAKAGSRQPLNLGLLDRILFDGARYRLLDDSALIATGAAQGRPPRPGETWGQYRTRLAQQALPHSAQGGVT
jgi:hypothetical protein